MKFYKKVFMSIVNGTFFEETKENSNEMLGLDEEKTITVNYTKVRGCCITKTK